MPQSFGNNILNVAMNAYRKQNQNPFGGQMEQQNPAGSPMPGMNAADNIRQAMEIARRRIMDLQIKMAKDPQRAQEYQAQIDFMMQKLESLQRTWDEKYGSDARAENASDFMDRQAARDEGAKAKFESNMGNSMDQTGGQNQQDQTREDVGPMGMTKERWEMMSDYDKRQFLAMLKKQTLSGQEVGKIPAWMYMPSEEPDAERNKLGAESSAGGAGSGTGGGVTGARERGRAASGMYYGNTNPAFGP